jgi:hypothetical protein
MGVRMGFERTERPTARRVACAERR